MTRSAGGITVMAMNDLEQNIPHREGPEEPRHSPAEIVDEPIDAYGADAAATVALAWRHFPDPVAHPRAVVFALAAEAAAAQGRFWALTRESLSSRHDDPADLEAAMVRAGLDPARTLDAVCAGTGAGRIVADTASAQASGVVYTPALFIDGERYRDDLVPAAVSAALDMTR